MQVHNEGDSSSVLQQEIASLRRIFESRFGSVSSSSASSFGRVVVPPATSAAESMQSSAALLLTPEETQQWDVQFLTAATELQLKLSALAEQAEAARKRRESP